MATTTALYFAYGSNLDPLQMPARCPSARFVCVASLADHRPCYPIACPDWGGGVLALEPAAGEAAEGVVYELDEADLAPLDEYENVAGGDYERRLVTLERHDRAGTLDAWTYFALRSDASHCPPSRRYLEAVLRGARHFGLSRRHLAGLAATETVDNGRRDLAFTRGRR